MEIFAHFQVFWTTSRRFPFNCFSSVGRLTATLTVTRITGLARKERDEYLLFNERLQLASSAEVL